MTDLSFTVVTDLSFTGPSVLTPAEAARAAAVLNTLRRDVTWRSGGADGLDTLVAEYAARVELVLPAERYYNRALRNLPNVIRVREVSGGYRERNLALVTGSATLHAFVKNGDGFYRSGEWMTVNLARHLGTPVTLYNLNPTAGA